MIRIAASLLTALLWVSASGAPCVRFHRTESDTLRINSLLAEASAVSQPGQRIVTLASSFLGTPYAGGTLEGPEECLAVNLDSLDCTTFVETVLAIGAAARDHRMSWRDFLGSLENIRYRSGTLTDYSSRLHYISDWALDNTHRGNFSEITDKMPRTAETTRSLDFMTTHASAYPALADPDMLARIKKIERNFRNYRFCYVRSADVSRPDIQSALRPGDVVAMVTRVKGLDVTHMGIIDKDPDGTVRLIHASSAAGEVVRDPLPLADYLKRHQSTIGIRIFRF